MNVTILVALIGTAGVIVGAILTFLASTLAARQRIEEIELTYHQKLDENYLVNVRMHIDTVYLPINVILTKLTTHYDMFKREFQSFYQRRLIFSKEDAVSEEKEMQEWEERNEQVTEEFRQACREFISEISALTNQGKDVYLTLKLDEHLQSFISFIKSSIDAEVPLIEQKAPNRAQYLFQSLIIRNPPLRHRRRASERQNTIYIQASLPNKGHRILDKFYLLREVSVHDYQKVKGKVISAPITSSLFGDRFLSDIHDLKSLIKEVTLGVAH